MSKFVKLQMPDGVSVRYVNLDKIHSVHVSKVEVSVNLNNTEFTITKEEFEKKLVLYLETNVTTLIKE